MLTRSRADFARRVPRRGLNRDQVVFQGPMSRAQNELHWRPNDRAARAGDWEKSAGRSARRNRPSGEMLNGGSFRRISALKPPFRFPPTSAIGGARIAFVF
jgi:hypothetical protein